MSQALWNAASGIRGNQTRLNVISNNIANVNTVGFKSASANFATVFASTIHGGSAPTGNLGGTNPMQQGNGMVVSEIASNFSSGGAQFTGRNTDMMINGEGFFAIERVDFSGAAANSSFFLTRAGNFSLDLNGNLVTSTGQRVRGTSQVSGSGPTTLTNVQIPQSVRFVKNLDATQNITATFIGTTAAAPPAAGPGGQSVTDAALVSFSVGSGGAITATYSNGDRLSVRLDPATVAANPTTPTAWRTEVIHLPAEGGTFSSDNDGNAAANDPNDAGIVTALDALLNAPAAGNQMEGMALQLQSATVTNPQGLVFDGNNNFVIGANSGPPLFGIPGADNRGGIQGGSLETSNVDLTTEFTNMVVTQRGIDANSRMVRTQSEVLQAVINMV